MEVIFTFKYHRDTINNGEKWGITFDECRNEFILSDGTFQIILWDASMLDAACESLLSMQDNYGVDDLWIVVIQSLRQTAGQQVKEVHALLLLYKRNISSTL